MSTSVFFVVVMTLWFECRAEPFAGKQAVASVIYNRAGGKVENMAAVCLKRKQFSCWNKRLPEEVCYPRVSAVNVVAWTECCRLASELTRDTFCPTGRWKHFHAVSVNPYWAEGKPGRRIARHIFYDNVL